MPERRLGDYALGEWVRTAGRTITAADLRTWAGVVGDWTELHVNDVLMRDSQFGAPIAHGYIAFNLAVGLMFPAYAHWYWPSSAVRHEGWSDVRFTAPVLGGDTLWCERRIVDITIDRPDSGVVVHDVAMVNQDGTRVFAGTERLRMRR